jgi:hypothetical protein
MADTPQLARLRRTRELILEILDMCGRQDRALRESLVETSAAIQDEEQR